MITEGYLARHYQGRQGGRDLALLDVAQDYALKILSDRGLFELGLTFKGGTALRKFRVGNRGRFSTDLDFAAKEEGIGALIFEQLHRTSLHEVEFRVEVVAPDRHARLSVQTPLGNPKVDARISVRTSPSWLPPEMREPVRLFVHEGYEFRPVSLPIIALEEGLAEKLAAIRRRGLVRDLYDLALFGDSPFNNELTRMLAHLKVYIDVVVEGLGEPPFDVQGDILRKSPDEFETEDIGLLAGEVDISGWVEIMRARFAFLGSQTEEEKIWARCNRRDLENVRAAIQRL